MKRWAIAVLLLAGCATGPLAPKPQASAPVLASACDGPPDASRPQYIIGYGSLMQDESRKRSSPQAGEAHPIELQGYRRGWFSRGSSIGPSTTFLGAVQDAASQFTAVIYAVDPAEVLATDKRERSYCRAAVPASQVKPLGGRTRPTLMTMQSRVDEGSRTRLEFLTIQDDPKLDDRLFSPTALERGE